MAPPEPFLSQHSKWFPSDSVVAQLTHLLNLCLQLCSCISLTCRSHAASQVWNNILGSARSVGKEGVPPPHYKHIQFHTWGWALSLRRGGGSTIWAGLIFWTHIFKFITYNGFHKSLPLQNFVSLSVWDYGWTASVLLVFHSGAGPSFLCPWCTCIILSLPSLSPCSTAAVLGTGTLQSWLSHVLTPEML